MGQAARRAEARRAVRALVTGAWAAQCVRAAAGLGLAGQLAAGPATSAELAAACGAHEPHLRRLLRVLAALGVLAVGDGDRYSLTPVGEELGENGLGAYALFFGSEPAWSAWSALEHSVRTGERAFDYAHQMGSWEYFTAVPEAARRFAAAMGALTAGVADSCDFSRYPLVVDVGGGDGTLLAEILRRCPRTRGVLADLPHVVDRARPALEAAGVLDRCDLHGGDMRTGVPQGDAYVLKSVLHDWPDDEATAILRRCRESGSPSAHLAVVERVLPDPVTTGNRDLEALLTDLNMMVMLGGRERTEAGYRDLLGAAGWRLGQVLPTTTEFSVIEATPC
jgi:hypothetical protein